MKIETINLQQFADVYENMENVTPIQSGSQKIFIGRHPDCHGFTIAFQHGASNEATVMRFDEAITLIN